jgi:hypothetical protein
VLRSGVVLFLAGQRVEFLHLDKIKKFERATMTRIGRYQIEARHLTGNASSRRDDLAPLKIFQTKLRRSISVCQRRSLYRNKA